jgi:hypothetical protein
MKCEGQLSHPVTFPSHLHPTPAENTEKKWLYSDFTFSFVALIVYTSYLNNFPFPNFE